MPHSGSTGLIAAPGKLVKLAETNTNRISEHMDTEFIGKSQYSWCRGKSCLTNHSGVFYVIKKYINKDYAVNYGAHEFKNKNR